MTKGVFNFTDVKVVFYRFGFFQLVLWVGGKVISLNLPLFLR